MKTVKAKTVRRSVIEKDKGKQTIYQNMQRRKNKFARVLKAGKPTPRQAALDKLTNWQKSQMMRYCKGKIHDLTDDQIVFFTTVKKEKKTNV